MSSLPNTSSESVLVSIHRRATRMVHNLVHGAQPLRNPLRMAADATVFRQQLERERELADRHGRHFALVVFPHLSISQDRLRVELFDSRLRSSDLIGTLEDGRIAGLLAETGAEDACRLARDLKRASEERGLSGAPQVYVYPHTGAAERVDAAARQVSNAAELFLAPISLRKRAMDVVCAAAGIAVLSPILIAIAVAIKLDSKGPVIYRQPRVGRGGQVFAFYKFRSMVVDADARQKELEQLNEATGPVFKMRRDPRITRCGAFLRKHSLDELPQLWNVLVGDMSLVGPRPPRVEEVEHYEPWQKRRLEVVGGLTCIWQVSGRSNIGFADWVRMDLRYARARGALLDLALLLRTIPCVVTGRGAY